MGVLVFALRSKELEIRSSNKTMSNNSNNGGDAFYFRGRSDRRYYKLKKPQSRSKSKSSKKPFKCFICHKQGHLKHNYQKGKKNLRDKDTESNTAEASIVLEGYKSIEALIMVNSHYNQD